MFNQGKIQRLLEENPWLLSIVAGIAAFGTYSCMYAYRKSFTAGVYEHQYMWGIDLKVCLILAQVMGYMLSKFIGITFISSINKSLRSKAVIGLIGLSWLALFVFALVPNEGKLICMFLNGLPIGMIWGLVFSFVEGRKQTELMAAIMASSIIFASGFVKSIGRLLLSTYHVTEHWMPFMVGLIFALPLLLFVYMLEQLPAPSESDKAARSARLPMNYADRIEFLKSFGPGLVMIVASYLIFTIARDVRDSFEVEIWSALGYAQQPTIFTQTDLPIAICVLVITSLLVIIKVNYKAFVYLHFIIIGGCLLLLISTSLYWFHFISPVVWMSIAGLGLFLAYIPYNSIYFERLLATFKVKGNVGFVMYICDAMGYLGSICILLFKQFGAHEFSWLQFFTMLLIVVAMCGIVTVSSSLLYFIKKHKSLSI